MIPGWKEEIEAEYLQVLMQEGRATPAGVAARLGVSESWVVFWLTALARDGRVRILAVEAIADGETRIDEQPAGRPEVQPSRSVTDLAAVLPKAA